LKLYKNQISVLDSCGLSLNKVNSNRALLFNRPYKIYGLFEMPKKLDFLFIEVEFAGYNFSFQNLSVCAFNQCIFKDCIFDYTFFYGSSFDFCEFENCSFKESYFSKNSWEGCSIVPKSEPVPCRPKLEIRAFEKVGGYNYTIFYHLLPTGEEIIFSNCLRASSINEFSLSTTMNYTDPHRLEEIVAQMERFKGDHSVVSAPTACMKGTGPAILETKRENRPTSA
jgi:hypothetical protein